MSDFITINTVSDLYKPIPKYDESWDIIQSLNYFGDHVEKNVTGWFYPFDNIIFHEIMKNIQKDIPGDVCELGVAFGKSAIAVSNYRKKTQKFYMYDFFNDDMRSQAEGNLNKYGTTENSELRVEDLYKLTADDIHFDNKLRFLHIDSSHEFKAVLKDMTNFSTKVSDDGVIVMDDYNDSEYPGVNGGCILFLDRNPDWTMFAIGHNKAYLCKKEYHNFYVLELAKCIQTLIEKYKINFQMNYREMFDKNVLLCCSRESKPYNDIVRNVNKPTDYI